MRLTREPDASPEPAEAGISCDDVREQRARDRGRRSIEREEDARGLLGVDGTVACLDELDEPIRGIEGKLHPSSLYEHMFAFKGANQKDEGAAPLPQRRPLRRASDRASRP